LITPRLYTEMRRSQLIPVIIDIENDVDMIKTVLADINGSVRLGRLIGNNVLSFGAPEIVNAFLQQGYVYDIELPTMRLLSTFLTKESIEKLNTLPEIRDLHYDMIKAAPPIILEKPTTSVFSIQSFLGGEPTEGWFGTYDVHRPLGIDIAHQEGYLAENIHIAVIDTGVHRFHRQLASSNIKAMSVLPGLRLLEKAVGDSSGHGSWCVSCINGNRQEVMEGIWVQGLTKAYVTSIRALFTPLGSGRDSDILMGMSLAYEQGAHIISMSLGGQCEGPECLLCGAVRDLSTQGIIMVIAAGNEGESDSVACPGRENSAITVASVSLLDNARSYFSSMGSQVDCAGYGGGRASIETTPEEYIYSAVSPYSMLDTLVDRRRSGYGLLCGTSMATPEIAALVALWYEYYYKATGRYLTGEDVHELLRQKGHAHSVEDGYGVPNFNWIKE
jgi:hypothetical protein